MLNSIRGATLAVAVAVSTATSALADTSMRSVEYHAFAQTTIFCATGLLCEIRLAKGEKITNAWSSAPLWAPSNGTAGDTPVFVVKPEKGSLRTNLILTTDAGRDYHLMLVSYDYNPDDPQSRLLPLYTRFVYDDERRNAALRQRIAAFRNPNAAPVSRTVPQQMDDACAKMPPDEEYRTDAVPADLRPEGLLTRGWRAVCHTADATYIQMPLGGPNPTDVPTLVEDLADGSKRIINYTYDPTSRVFKVDDVATEYTLTTGQGKREAHLRIQRHVGQIATAAAPAKGKR